MLDVLADRGGDVALPLAVGATAVAVTWVSRSRSHRATVMTGIAAVAFLGWVRGRLPDVVDALVEGPWWFPAMAVGAGVAAAAALSHLVAAGRPSSGLATLGVTLGAAAAALPDVEVMLGAAALWIPWLVGPEPTPSPPPARRWPGEVVAALVAATVVVAVVDGSRGRPASLLLAPIVVGPVALCALFPALPSRSRSVAWVVAAGIVGILVARHAGLGSGTARPIVGSLLGLAVLVAARGALGIRDERRPPTPGR